MDNEMKYVPAEDGHPGLSDLARMVAARFKDIRFLPTVGKADLAFQVGADKKMGRPFGPPRV